MKYIVTILIIIQSYSKINGQCITDGGLADDSGLKTWCWSDIDVPAGGPNDYSFSNGQLGLSIECNPNQVTRVGNRLRFYLNPTTPSPQSWCRNSFNMRAEISTNPWEVNHPIGTEEWFGFSYTFGDNYIADSMNDWLFFQVHEATVGESPLLSLQVSNGNPNASKGEILAANASQSGYANSYFRSNLTPVAGETVDVVMHIIWGDDTNGLWEVWLNGNQIHSLQARTVRASHPVGGNAKFGIYKHGWRNKSAVQNSANLGITDLETYMGSLRIITRHLGDPNYLDDSYNEVMPKTVLSTNTIDVKLYKNQLHVNGLDIKQIIIYDIRGVVIKNITTTYNDNTIEMNELPSGIYIVKSILVNGFSSNTKIINK